jgi:hypothetical protein
MQVKITIKAGALTATDGSTNSKKITREFIGVATPEYATVDYIITNGGEFLEMIPESAIYALSFAASTLVDDIVLFDPDKKFPDKSSMSWRFFNRARTEFVKCKVAADLLKAVTATKGLSASRKLLADFSIDNASLAGVISQARPLIKDYVDCYSYWQKVLFAGGAIDFESPMAKSAVKAGWHVDGFGGIGRGWLNDSDDLNYRMAEGQQGDKMSRPKRFGFRNPMAEWLES